MGYILRLTTLNRYAKPSWILQITGICTRFRFTYPFVFDEALDLSTLAKITDIDEDMLSRLLYHPVVSEAENGGGYLVFGSPAPQYIIRPNQSKICPGCLRESNYARKIWDLAPVTTCPIHKCLLLEECPNCQKRISWIRRGISLCPCKLDWRDYDPPTLDILELQIAHQIHIICRLPVPLSTMNLSSNANPLYDLNLKDFWFALFFVASQYIGSEATKRRKWISSIRNLEIHPLLCKAWRVFEHWPDSYFAFLDWRRAQLRETEPVRGLLRDFSGYKFNLYQRLSSDQLNFMRSAFEEYLATRWDGGYTSHLRRLSEATRQNEKYVSRRGAKELLKIAVQGVDNLVAAGKLKAIIRDEGKRRLILIEKDSLQEFKRELDQSLYLKQVVTIIGFPNYRIMELIKCGLLNPLRGPVVDKCSDWKFSQNEVRDLLNSIKSKVKPIDQSLNHSTITFRMALRKPNRIGICIGQFIQDILEDKISPCGEGEKGDIAALLFSCKHVADYVCRQRKTYMGEVLSADEGARFLGVSRELIRRLAKVGVIQKQMKYYDLLISKADLEQFNSTYVLPGHWCMNSCG